MFGSGISACLFPVELDDEVIDMIICVLDDVLQDSCLPIGEAVRGVNVPDQHDLGTDLEVQLVDESGSAYGDTVFVKGRFELFLVALVTCGLDGGELSWQLLQVFCVHLVGS